MQGFGVPGPARQCRPYSPRVALDFSRVGEHADAYRWEDVRDVLEEAIASGEIPPRTRLPSETYIAQSARVTAKTVRRAIRDLRDRGLVYTRPGLGTFASRDDPPPG